MVPRARTQAAGVEWAVADAVVAPLERVYVADSESDSAASINAKLASGLHVLLCPGVYELDAPLRLGVSTSGQVLLGLGMYETHNKLDSHMDRLFGGVVTNESLYLRMD